MGQTLVKTDACSDADHRSERFSRTLTHAYLLSFIFRSFLQLFLFPGSNPGAMIHPPARVRGCSDVSNTTSFPRQ